MTNIPSPERIAPLADTFAEMGKAAADPMWADHVELPKAVLRRWIKSLRAALKATP